MTETPTSRSSGERAAPTFRVVESECEASGHSATSRDVLLAALADEFAERVRRGEQPQIEDYARRHPQLSGVIREVFPALELLNDGSPEWTGDDLPAESAEVGRTIGDYRIVREIGRGGMGVVYEAEQLSLQRRVALKVLPFAGVLDPRQLARFKNEALAAARLEHPHIVDVYAVGCERAVHFYAMQFIDGHNLAEVIGELRRLAGAESDTPVAAPDGSISRQADTALLGGLSTAGSVRTPLFFRTVARLGIEAAEALDDAHQHGIVHRDIKPSNLMLDSRGKLWITDFGLAQVESDAGVTMSGDLVGTLRYMSPEQALGHRRLIDHRSDIYSLGATLYELLTLRPVFPETDRQKLLQQIGCAEPSAPRRLNESIPADLETILLRALAREPQERYATAQELADDLRRYLDDKPISAKRTTWRRRVGKWLRRHPSLMWSGALSLLLILAGLTAATLLIWRSQRQTETALDDARELKQQAETERDVAQQRLYEARLAQARAGRRSGKVGQRFESLKALREGSRLARELRLDESAWMDLRNEAIACLALTDVRLDSEWEVRENFATFDSDFAHYATNDTGGIITVRRVADHQELARLVAPEKTAHGLKFSPDGSLLAVFPIGTARTLVWDWRKQSIVFRSPFSDATACPPCFHPDGSRLAIAPASGLVALFDLANGRQVAQIDTKVQLRHMAFSPDGSKLAAASPDARLVGIWEISSGKLLNKFANNAHSVVWHPQGRLLAIADDTDRHVHIGDSETGNRHSVLRGHHNLPWELNFSGDGNLFCSSSWDGTVRLWNPNNGQELFRVLAVNGRISADGRRLGSQRGRKVQLWELALGEAYRTLPVAAPISASTTALYDQSISADGRWLAVATASGLSLYDFAQGKLLAQLPLGTVMGVAFHPSGTALFTGGWDGLDRWPLTTESGVLRLGPPTRLAAGLFRQLDLDRQGRFLVGSHLDNGAMTFELDKPETPARRLEHGGSIYVAISPDARWIATGTKWGQGVRVWETATGALKKPLLPNEQPSVSFIADGRWLVTQYKEAIEFWNVGSWTLVRQISTTQPGFAASPDGRLLAYTRSPYEVQMEDAATGQPLAILQAPDGNPVHRMDFTPDGSRLVVSSYWPAHVRVWDLRLLRRQLAEMSLDWDAPPDPVEATDPQPVTRVRVELK